MNQQKFAIFLGIVIVISHIVISIYLWIGFELGRDDGVFAKEIALPMTLTYAISVVKWFTDTRGIITQNHQVGIPFVVLVSIIVTAFLGCLLGGAVYFSANLSVETTRINNFYVSVEAAFGGMFAMIFSELYGKSTTNP